MNERTHIDAAKLMASARELGATLCGIADISLFADEPPERDPKLILPNAKCVVGFGLRVPRSLYTAMDEGRQFYTYTTLGVKYIDEAYAEIFLNRIGALLEDAGYDACLQRSVPNIRVKGDKSANPEVSDVYELVYSEPVAEGKPAPEVIIDYNKAATLCGFGAVGLHGKVIAPKYGTFMRYVFIITDAPLECGKPFEGNLCDGCGLCVSACPGHAVSEDGVDSWQCAVYYRGAHRSNPFMSDDFLRGDPERDDILNGGKRFDRESARAIFSKLKFLPNTHNGYVPCLCGKRCETVCYKHLKEDGAL